jgi:hypothetical protein
MFAEDGRIVVTLGVGNSLQEMAIQFIHEGSHVADYQAFEKDPLGADISLLATETRAWTVSAFAAMGFGFNKYPSSLSGDLQVWKKGWTESPIAIAVANNLSKNNYNLTPQNDGGPLSDAKRISVDLFKRNNSQPEWSFY